MSFTTGTFSDAELSADWMREQVAKAAVTQGWTTGDQDTMRASIDNALEAADDASWWGYDAVTFWTALQAEAAAWTFKGAQKARDIIASASGTAGTLAATEEEFDFPSQLGEVVVESAEDAAAAAEAAKKAASSPTVWLVVGGIALGVFLLGRGR